MKKPFISRAWHGSLAAKVQALKVPGSHIGVGSNPGCPASQPSQQKNEVLTIWYSSYLIPPVNNHAIRNPEIWAQYSSIVAESPHFYVP